MKTLCILMTTALLAGCAAQQIQKRTVAFHAAEFAPFQGSGTATIKGQAFLKTRAGDIKLGAGNTVYLMPATPYTDEWFQKSVVGNALLEQPVNLDRYQRKTVADAGGNFEFADLPPGKYYVTCFIGWEYATGGYGSSLTGGIAHAIAQVSAGETKKVIATLE